MNWASKQVNTVKQASTDLGKQISTGAGKFASNYKAEGLGTAITKGGQAVWANNKAGVLILGGIAAVTAAHHVHTHFKGKHAQQQLERQATQGIDGRGV